MIGGAADLAPSTKSNMIFDGAGSFGPDNYSGRNLHFGIREHAMGSICNGIALSGLRTYGSGFLIFSDYMKAPIRLSAIMELPVVYIFTHDSIGVGEDGPTHQPIEQIASLRAIPGMIVLRPADANEVAESWRIAMGKQNHPVCLILSRQALPTIDRSKFAPAAGTAKGAYVLADAEGGKPDVILMGTGSEVSLCMVARETLRGEGIKVSGGVHAVVGVVRGTAGELPRCGAATGRAGACGGGAGGDHGLAPLCRPERRGDRDAHLSAPLRRWPTCRRSSGSRPRRYWGRPASRPPADRERGR